MNNKLIISLSPHIHGGNTTSKAMHGVLIALIPAFIVSLFYFGLGALIVTITSVLACVIFEYLIQKYLLKAKSSIHDGSAIITGGLLAFNLPSNLPIWIIIIGALVAIGIGKMSFGGLGCNIFNPALVGRVFLLISFPVQMTTWPKPEVLSTHYIDVQTGATTLTLLKAHMPIDADYTDMLLGNMGGSLGEVGAIALRTCIYVVETNNNMAYPSLNIRDCCNLLFTNRYRSHYPNIEWRPFVRCNFHGNRLCHLSHE